MSWKDDAVRMRLDDGLSWSEITSRIMPKFPDKSEQQVRDMVRRDVRRSERYKQEAAKRSNQPKPPEPDYNAATGWKNGVFESDDLIAMCREDAKSPRRMLELHGLDPDKWEVVSCRNNLWHSQVHHSLQDEKGARTLLYQSRLTAKPKKPGGITFADIERYFAEKDFNAPPPIIPIQYDPDGEVLEIDIADLHSGLLAWCKETGADYDVHIARDAFMRVIADNIERCKGRRFRSIILALLGDLLHIDNDLQQTTKGTFQQADGRIGKIFDTTLDALIDAVLMLGEIAPVDVVYTSGNHDGTSGWMLIKSLQMAFRTDPNVNIDVEPNPQKVRLIGDSLIGFVHGDMPEKNLSGWLQVRARQMDKPIRFLEVHSGHRHSEKRKERIQTDDNEGLIVRTMPTITNASTWEHRSGYVARRSSVSFVWHEKAGLREMWYCNM